MMTGPIVQNGYWRDTITFLDMGWRVQQGQVPHVDYHSPLGILFHLGIGAAMSLCGISVTALEGLVIFMFLLFSLWSFWISSERMTPLCALIATFTVGLISAGTYDPGCPVQATTYAGLYNRCCFAMTLIILIEQFFPPRRLRASETAAGFSTGLLLAALFFTKLTFFGVAAGSIILRTILEAQAKKWWAGFAAGIFAVALPLLTMLRFNIVAFIDDCTIFGRVQGTHLLAGSEALRSKLLPVLWQPGIILALCIIMPGLEWQWKKRSHSKSRICLASLYFILGAAMLHLTNYGPGDMLLISVVPLFLWQYIQLGKSIEERDRMKFLVFASACVLLINGPVLYRNLSSISYALECKRAVLDVVPRFDSSSLGNLYVRGRDDLDNVGFVEKINDGIALLRRNIGRDDRIISLDFENPFSVALLQKSPRGDSIHYEINVNFNEKIFWKAEPLFHDATVLIVQRHYDPRCTGPLITIYKDYIRSNFRKIDESEYWILFMRQRRDK